EGQQFELFTINIPTVIITEIITATPTTIIETIIRTQVTIQTETPNYFNDTNVINQDIITVIAITIIAEVIIFVKYQARIKKKTNIADNYINNTLRQEEIVTNTITPIANV
ncbi:3802_t:CDS:1, partial [Dentiscutata heterogama]